MVSWQRSTLPNIYGTAAVGQTASQTCLKGWKTGASPSATPSGLSAHFRSPKVTTGTLASGSSSDVTSYSGSGTGPYFIQVIEGGGSDGGFSLSIGAK